MQITKDQQFLVECSFDGPEIGSTGISKLSGVYCKERHTVRLFKRKRKFCTCIGCLVMLSVASLETEIAIDSERGVDPLFLFVYNIPMIHRYHYIAEVVRVIDADTIVFKIDLGFDTHRVEHIRVLDYDAPEVKLYSGVTQEEKDLGLKAKARAEELLPVGKKVALETFKDKTGKYGRYLANIMYEDFKDFAHTMIEEGYVKDRQT